MLVKNIYSPSQDSCLFDAKRIGISTNIYNNPEDIARNILRLSNNNFSVIEIELENNAKKSLDTDSRTYDRTIEKLDRIRNFRQLEYSVHAPYIGHNVDLCAEDRDVRQRSCNFFRKSIQFCADLGVERLTFHPGYISDLPINSILDNLKLSLEDLVPEAERKGVKLCQENTGANRPYFPVFSPTQLVELSRETGTYITLDIVHLASYFSTNSVLDPQFFESIKQMLLYVKNIHLADMVLPKHVHLPFGKGNLEVIKILNFLVEQNYQGKVIIEEMGGGFSSHQFLEAACKFKADLSYIDRYSLFELQNVA